MPNTPLIPNASASTARKKLVLLDGNSLLYRGFFAMRALTTSTGIPTNAVFSFTMMLLTLLEQQKPDVIICAWDTPKPTFRHEAFADYKGTRSAPPDELKQQGPIAREMLQAFAVPMIEAPGFEADDVIGTLAGRGNALGYDILIVTGDLDALQLVEPGVQVMTTVKGVTDVVYYDEAAVFARYGLRPDQLADYRGLKGDTSDNIPGVPGVGEKTASQLLQQYGDIENLIAHVGEIKQAKLQASLAAATEQMRQSRHLAVILRDVPLEIDIPALDAAPHAPHWEQVRELFERLEFRQMLRRIPKEGSSSPLENTMQRSVASREERSPERGGGGIAAPVDIEADDYDPFAADDDTPAPAPIAPVVAPEAAPPFVEDFHDAGTPGELKALIAAARKAGTIGLRLHVNDGLLDSRILGVALGIGGKGQAFYVPVEAGSPSPPAPSPVSGDGGLGNLFAEPVPSPQPRNALPPELKTLLEDASVAKVTHEAKGDIAVLERYGVCLRGITFDTELAAYLLSAGRRAGYPLNEIAADYAERKLLPLDKKERKAAETDVLFAHDKTESLKEADAVLALQATLEPRLAGQNLLGVLREMDLPIAPILAEMELAGLALDVGAMERIAREMQAKIEVLQTQIYEIAGVEFSIGSIKQLQEVLFERLKLPAGKKNKTGWSTSALVLEELAPDYPIVNLVLSYRELTKLKNTYADAMPALVRADTKRLHTSLNQTVAATGRLSSSNPNLQNIPIRTEIGREIRRAFVAAPGHVLISADYSQIELRLFAHVSHDPELIAAFSSGEDIHKYTAAKMYRVPVAEVTGDMRRNAKTVNYAVIYGISEFALGRMLGISMTEAKDLKTSYFERFPGVRAYLDQTVAFAREHGYVQTLFGRRRWMPDIKSPVFQFRQAAERAAANMPIQGSSADIMKLAMIKVYEMMRREKFQSRLLLQVHDELLFESPPEEVGPLAAQVHECMATAFPLAVALEVEVKTGATWADVTPVGEMEGLEVEAGDLVG